MGGCKVDNLTVSWGAQPGETDAADGTSRLRGERLEGCETLSMCDLVARILSEADGWLSEQ